MAQGGKTNPDQGFRDITKERERHYYRKGIMLLIFGVSLISMMFSSWADDLARKNLIFHMFGEHSAFTLGALFSSLGVESWIFSIFASGNRTKAARTLTRLYAWAVLVNHRLNAKGRVGLPTVAGILGFWHVPQFFDAAALEPQIHALFHLSIIATGILIFLNLKVLSKIELVKYSIISGFVMDVYGRALMGITTPIEIYSTYPLAQQVLTGQIMFLGMLGILPILIIYGIVLFIKSVK